MAAVAPLEPFDLPDGFPVRVIERTGLFGRTPRERAHRHRACEVTCVRKGETVYELGGHEYPLGPGDVVVVGELEGHQWRERGDGEGAKTVVLFDPVVVRWPRAVRGGAVSGIPEAGAMVDRIVEELGARRPGFETIVTAALERLLTLCERESVSLSALVRRGLAFMRLHASEAIAIPDVAAACGVSTAYLREVWRREVGVSPLQALKEIRAGLAARLLTQPGARVADVAAAAGYGSLSAFERAFRSVYGCAPGVYRRQA